MTIGMFLHRQPKDLPWIFSRTALSHPAIFGPVVEPDVHLFVMGDNYAYSPDSGYWRFLPMKREAGKTHIRLFTTAWFTRDNSDAQFGNLYH